jgi:hemerythrin-like domain-containing protein
VPTTSSTITDVPTARSTVPATTIPATTVPATAVPATAVPVTVGGEAPADLTMYFQVHRAMRQTGAELADALAGMADADRRRAVALVRFYRGFATELHTHHHLEDELFFPALAERVATFEHLSADLDADHVRLATLIDDLARALDAMAGTAPWHQARTEALAVATELRDHLRTHLDVEDQDVIPLFARHFTASEYEELEAQAVKEGSLKTMLFTCPWLVASAEPEVRDHIFETVPSALKVLWKLTRRGYARRTSYALGIEVPVVRS